MAHRRTRRSAHGPPCHQEPGGMVAPDQRHRRAAGHAGGHRDYQSGGARHAGARLSPARPDQDRGPGRHRVTPARTHRRGDTGHDHQRVALWRLCWSRWTRSGIRAAKRTSCCSARYSYAMGSIRIVGPTCASCPGYRSTATIRVLAGRAPTAVSASLVHYAPVVAQGTVSAVPLVPARPVSYRLVTAIGRRVGCPQPDAGQEHVPHAGDACVQLFAAPLPAWLAASWAAA